jgi:hypothetical protein
MVLDGAGKVGIGSTDPQSTLDVRGTAHFMINYNGNFPSYGSEMGKGGLAIGWNASGVKGETNLVNFPGDGSGGFSFVLAKKDGSINNTPFAIYPNGRLKSPMWNVTQPFHQYPGTATVDVGRDGVIRDHSLQTRFSTGGGTLLVIFSGTARIDRAGTLTIKLHIERLRDWTEVAVEEFTFYSDFQSNHFVFPTCFRVVAGIEAGDYQLFLRSDYATDKNDYYELVVIEFPFLKEDVP